LKGRGRERGSKRKREKVQKERKREKARQGGRGKKIGEREEGKRVRFESESFFNKPRARVSRQQPTLLSRSAPLRQSAHNQDSLRQSRTCTDAQLTQSKTVSL